MAGDWLEQSPESPDGTLSTAESETDSQASSPRKCATATVSGATGKHMAEELKRWVKNRSKRDSGRLDLARNTWEKVEVTVAAYYDSGPLAAVINFIYDLLQLSSGRDKSCALLQGYAKLMSAMVEANSERYFMYRGVEDSLSEGRKIFRLFKEFREVYKIRRGFHRMQEGIATQGIASIATVCGTMDVLGHTASFFYYLFDNISWAASVGILRTKEIPKWQVGMWKGFRRNGKAITWLGGVTKVKWRKNTASIWRLNFAITANVLLLFDAFRNCRRKDGGQFQGPDDPRLFHTIELVGMFASYRSLLAKLNFVKMKSHRLSGILQMLASICGLWGNWRKVVRKKCGTKPFVTVVEQREKLQKSSSANDLSRLKNKSLDSIPEWLEEKDTFAASGSLPNTTTIRHKQI